MDLPTPRWARTLTRFSLEQAAKYHDLSLIIEDKDALRPGRPYVVGELLPLWALSERVHMHDYFALCISIMLLVLT